MAHERTFKGNHAEAMLTHLDDLGQRGVRRVYVEHDIDDVWVLAFGGTPAMARRLMEKGLIMAPEVRISIQGELL